MAKQLPAADRGQLAALAGFLAAADRLEARLDDALQSSVGVSYAWFGLLLGVADSPDQRILIGELGRRLSLTSGGVTRFVDRVEAAGLVSREPSLTDRRALFVTFTDRGRDVLRRGQAVLTAVYQREVVATVSKGELAALGSASARIAPSSVADVPAEPAPAASRGRRPTKNTGARQSASRGAASSRSSSRSPGAARSSTPRRGR